MSLLSDWSDLDPFKYRRTRQVFLLLAWLSIGIGIYWALKRNPGLLTKSSWDLVIPLIVLFAPLTFVCNATAITHGASLLGRAHPFVKAIKASIAGTLANQLPLPASFMIRVGALRSTGATLGDSVYATVVVSVAWFAGAFVLAATSAWLLGAVWVAAIGYGLALVAATMSILPARRLRRRILPSIFGLGMGVAFLDAVRLYICFAAIGIEASVLECLLLSAANALANVIAVIPGGVGIREFGTAALATLTGIDPASALVAATVNRIAGLLSAGLLLGVLQLRPSSTGD